MVTKTCVCNSLHSEGNFNNIDDFYSLEKNVSSSSNFYSVSVDSPYSNVGFVENWYKCSLCGSVWRLVEPDPPFYGIWSRV